MYSCPDCGAELKFNVDKQAMLCAHCNNTFDPYSIKKDNDAEMETEFEVTKYKCNSCGGELISADENTAADFCPFCGSSAILTPNISKEKRPEYIIPFKVSKDDCVGLYVKHIRNAFFVPKELRASRYLKEFKGIYMPYWTYCVDQQGPFSMKMERYISADNGMTTTEKYNLVGDINASYRGMSHDASNSFSDSISEDIAPFDVHEVKAFTPSYLCGFFADTADIDKESFSDDAIEFANVMTARSFGESVTPTHISSKITSISQSLFPVWLLTYKKKDRVAYATINGQTGKISSDLPMDYKRFAFMSILLALAIFGLFMVIDTLPFGLMFLTVSVIGMVTSILYCGALKDTVAREYRLEDRSHRNSYSNLVDDTGEFDSYAYSNVFLTKQQNKDKNEIYQGYKKTKKAVAKVASGVLASTSFSGLYLLFILLIELFGTYLPFIDAIFKPVFPWLVIAIITSIYVFKSIKYYRMVSYIKSISKGFVGAIISMLITGVAILLNIDIDLYMHIALSVSIICVLVMVFDLLKLYNILATRKVMQFQGEDY